MVARAAAEFFERTPQPALILGAAEEVVASNAAFRDLYGSDPVGRTFRTLFQPKEAALLRIALAGEGRLNGHLARDGEEVCPVHLDITPATPGHRYAIFQDRREQLRYERQLERLGAVARKTTNSVVISDASGRIDWVNEAFTAQTGYTLDEVRGLMPGALLNSPLNDPDTMGLVEEAFVRNEAIKIELIERRKDGSDNIVEMDAAPVFAADGALTSWVAIKTNVTQRREEQRRLVEAERRAEERRRELNAAFEAMDVGFILYDSDDRLVLCNERFRHFYAQSADGMILGRTFEEIARYSLERGQSLTANGRVEEWLKKAMELHRLEQAVIEHRLADGRWIRIIERNTPDGGRVGLHVDITPLKEQQLALDEAARRAEAANHAKSVFLATMSHEIRTPLNGVLGIAELLDALVSEEGQKELVRALRESGETLLTILNDILDFSKIEAGQMTLEAIPIEADDIARRIQQLHEPLAREKGLAFTIESSPGPARRGDPTRLIQVLNNLVSNGIKFTDAGGVRLRIENDPDSPLVITVSDTGIGMEEGDLQRLYDRFAQADSSITRRYGGTGLGLSIVHGLVSAMGGGIAVATAKGQGTTVTITLPLDPLEAHPAAAAAPAAQPLAGLHVLAADDNQTNRTVLARMLERLGATTRMTASGAEVVAAAAEGWHDILLLDISMPDMDGVEALARIRTGEAEAARPAAPAIAVTANALDHQVEQYLAAGFDGHLAKPLRLPILSDACRAALGDRRPGTRSRLIA